MQPPIRPLADVLTGSGLVMKPPTSGVGAPPHIIGTYALFAELAAGGMGAVHLARRLGPTQFEPVVAIKRAHAQLATDPDLVTLFRQEIRLLSSVRHRNVAAALGVVEAEGELLLVMEYVHGQALSSLARQARDFNQAIPTEICLAIACDMLDGLHAAHDARDAAGNSLGIVHRDVSPQNVMVGCDGCARILDFGVAKARDSSNFTSAGQVKGKLGYLAPEHILGKKLDGRADVYAASVVLWEVLAQARLFGAKRDNETVQDILAGDIPRPSVVSSRRLPVQLEDVLMRGLATDPARRFTTAAEMAQALREAAPVASLTDVGEWVTRAAHRSLVERSRQLAWAENCPLPMHPSLRASSQPDVEVEVALRVVAECGAEPAEEQTQFYIPRPAPEPEPEAEAELTIVDQRFSGPILDPVAELSPEPGAEVTERKKRGERPIVVARRYALYVAAFVAVLSVINQTSGGALSRKLRARLHPEPAPSTATVRAEAAPAVAAEPAPPVVDLSALPVEPGR